MRHGIPLAIPWLVVVAGVLHAQERIALPPPDPTPPGEQLPPPSSLNPQSPAPLSPPPPGSYAPPPLYPPPGPYGPYPPPGPYGPYPPPLDPYVQTSPGAVVPPNPVNNPIFWFGFEGLVWWTKNQPVSVPLVTTGPASQGASAGALGMPGTTSLDGPLSYSTAGGVRLYAGGWFNYSHTLGMDGSLFILGEQSAGYNVVDRSGTGALVINEPVVGAPFNTQVSAPGVETGSVFVGATGTFGGGDLNFLYNVYRSGIWTVNLLGGWRYLQLNESLNIAANSNLFTTTTYTDNMGNVLATAPPGSSVQMLDHFGTRNQFNGAQLGCQAQYQYQRLFLTGAAKFAIGDTYEVVTASGNTTVLPVNGIPVQLTGGNYVTLQAGRYSTSHFAWAPEIQFNIGYQLTPCLRASIGYDFLYLSSVARPGNQIDNTYDGVTHPLVPLTSSSFWAQGLTLSLQVNF